MRSLGLLVGACCALAVACQSYNMEAVDPQTVIAVETGGTFTSARAPVLLIVQDRSLSMTRSFGAQGQSRMEVARDVVSRVVTENADGVHFGLSAYGVSTDGDACGPPLLLVPPGPNKAPAIVAAFGEHPALVTPAGGTPTAAALRAAYDDLVDEQGRLREPDRKNFVVLVTDGLMNCNPQFPPSADCICATENDCGAIKYGEVITSPADRRLCLDLDETRAALVRLHDAGVKTFVIGMGEALVDDPDLAQTVLNVLAIDGGVPREGPIKFHPAGDPEALEAALSEIVRSITAPCVYELPGGVCDGRLIAITLDVRSAEGQPARTIETRCDPGLGADSWYFENDDPRRLVFAPSLCAVLEDAFEVKVRIRGIENACPEGVTPSCGAPPAP